MQKKLILLAGVILLGPMPAAARSEQAISAFNQGVELFNAGQAAEAMPYFDKAIDRDARFAQAFYARGACKHSLQNTEGALSDLNQAIEIKPDYIDAFSLRGAIWYEVEQWEAALRDFEVVLRDRPDNAQALLGHGIVSLKQDHLRAAEGDFRRYLALKPNDPMAPQLRKLLASMKQDAEQLPGGGLDAGAGVPARRSASPESDNLAHGLSMESHSLSDSFNQKVLRGERAQAVGETPPAPAAEPDPLII
jgi:tetratricopeptide (TPR) repeat protein